MKKDDMREEDLKAIIKNVNVDEPEVEVILFMVKEEFKCNPQDLAFENEIRTTPSLLKKRIKKIQRKTGSDDKLKIALKEQERANSKAKKELFNGVNERKKRRVRCQLYF